MAFLQAVSGLSGAASALDVIGNNLANASTVGFKGARSEFADLFAAYLPTGMANANAHGTATYRPHQQFTQGSLRTTENPLDFSISGNGMFVVNGQADGTGNTAYTRNGEFHFDPVKDADGQVTGERYIANAQGQYLMGWGEGVASTDAPAVLKLVENITPQVTSSSTMSVNLDDRAAATAGLPFDPDDPNSYNWSTSQQIFSGVSGDKTIHDLQLYFAKTSNPNVWQMHTRIDGQIPAEEASGPRTLTFSASGFLTGGGTMTSSSSLNATTETVAADGTVTQTQTPVTVSLAMDLSRSTLFASKYSLNQETQDGFADGRMNKLLLTESGGLSATYSNGETRELGKLALATFVNLNGLQSVGENLWRETAASGVASIGEANSGGRGVLNSGRVEEANVDIASELVNMIVQQRNYQANAQTIKTQDDMLRSLVGLR